jgi:two-component system response regulator FlrC
VRRRAAPSTQAPIVTDRVESVPPAGDSPCPAGPGADVATAWSEFERQLQRAAASDTTVLLTGESGAGKSRAARRLHELGRRRAGPLVAVHLAGLAETLIDAELFGHAAGAFTGAREARAGRFVRAEAGTVVLEGIDTLAQSLQVKLLRVLQERVVEPLGAEAVVPIDVRIVATTALDLADEVARGRFRQDLYFRLAVVRLTVPPLRARPEALPGLAVELGAEVAARLGVPPRVLTPAALQRLAAHPWPGNVRELENALERAHVLAGARGAARPDTGDLDGADFDFLGEGLVGAARGVARAALAQGLGAEELLAALVAEALAAERGNASAAARRLGLTRRAFDQRRPKPE